MRKVKRFNESTAPKGVRFTTVYEVKSVTADKFGPNTYQPRRKKTPRNLR